MDKLTEDIYLLCIQCFLFFLLGSERLALYMFKASLSKIRYKALICVPPGNGINREILRGCKDNGAFIDRKYFASRSYNCHVIKKSWVGSFFIILLEILSQFGEDRREK